MDLSECAAFDGSGLVELLRRCELMPRELADACLLFFDASLSEEVGDDGFCLGESAGLKRIDLTAAR